MGNNYFHFKQFTIHHDRCAMKVGTDGVVLGAWAPLPDEGRVLDIGTGSGLMALMIAQRGSLLHVTGIDIDAEAVLQACENVAASPFAGRVSIDHLSLQQLMSDASQASSFDAIVCNPPFFESSLLPPDAQRAQARHNTSLPFNELIHGAHLLLRSGGLFSVILPTDSFDEFRRMCFVESLYVKAAVHVQTSPRKTPKRVMACFVKDEIHEASADTLVLTEAGTRSADYRRLTDDFYLY